MDRLLLRFTMLLAAVMPLLSACGQVPSTGNPPSAAPSGQADTPVQTDSSSQSDGIGAVEPFDPSAVMEETVLGDESDEKITVTEIQYTTYSVKLNLAIENNSGQSLSFRTGTLGYNCNSINGYMVDDRYLNASVSPGKKTKRLVSNYDTNLFAKTGAITSFLESPEKFV